MNTEMYTGGFDTEEPGEKTVTVTHRGLTAQFIVTVKGEPEPVSKTTLNIS